MRRVCRFVILAYIIVCIAALAIIPMTAAGTFGIQPDPLSGIYALLLASPWILLLADFVGNGDMVANMAMAAISMAINVVILLLLCRWLTRRRY